MNMKILKSIICLLLTVTALSLSSCQKKNPTDKILDAIKATSEKLDKTKSHEERLKLMQELGEKMQKLEKEIDQSEISPEDQQKIGSATQELMLKAIQSEAGEAPVKEMQNAQEVDQTTQE